MPVQLLAFLHMIGVTIRPLAEKKNLLLAGVYMEKFNPVTGTKYASDSIQESIVMDVSLK